MAPRPTVAAPPMERDWLKSAAAPGRGRLRKAAACQALETVFTVADGIQGQGFEPTPSWAACSMCDYRIACPAAER